MNRSFQNVAVSNQTCHPSFGCKVIPLYTYLLEDFAFITLLSAEVTILLRNQFIL